MSTVSFYGSGHCGDCDSTWDSEPVPDGTVLESDHECPEATDGSDA
ncbi:hypothetical protein [Streptomyces triculaminicus]